LLVLAALAWAVALVYSVTRSEPEPLDDASRALLARACSDAQQALHDVGDLEPGATPEDAGGLVERENRVYAQLVGEMRAASPTDAEGAEALAAWLDDWDRLLAARTEHARELLAGETSGFDLPAERAGSSKPITVRMDEYAEMKGLEECTPTVLRAEITDAARQRPAVDREA
jgi:hypothetical protein